MVIFTQLLREFILEKNSFKQLQFEWVILQEFNTARNSVVKSTLLIQ